MKLLLPPLLLLALAAPTRDQITLRFEPQEGTELERVFEAHAEYRLTALDASIDGEPLGGPEELPDYRMEFDEHIAVTDRLDSVEDGRPLEVRRTFDELSQNNVDSVDGEDYETSYSSDLQGRTVVFRWDDDEQAYSAEAGDDDDLDDDLAGWLAEDMDLRLVLPDHEVEVGDEWELDPKLYLAFMWPSGLLDFRGEDEEPSEEERDPSRQTIENIDGSGTAELEEIREEDGVRVAVIHVQMDITTGSESVLPEVEPEGDDEPGRPEMTIEVEIERSLEGTILWDLDHGHALGAELEGSSSRRTSRKVTLQGERDGEEFEADLEESRLLEGTITYSAKIERR